MRKEQRAFVIEFIGKLNEDDLRFLYTRLTEQISSDHADALEYLSKNSNMDSILASALSSTELFDMSDHIRDIVSREAKKRKLVVYPLPPDAFPVNE